ncbi:MAG TPA: FtsX-like permease family protein, partial [Anaerolineae bacterium]|nr:FtsX-like permease family protein [Anaerolineae bacterium]
MMTNTIIMAFRYLAGRRLRTTLTTLAVVFGVAVIFAGNLMLPAAMDAFWRSTTAAAGGADISLASSLSTYFRPEQAMATLRGVPGVRAVTPVLSRAIAVPPAPEVELIGVDPATVQDVHPYPLASGRFLQPGDHLAAVVSAPREGQQPVALGDAWPVATAEGMQQYTVVGIFSGPPSLTPQLIVPLADAQAALGQPGMVSGLEVAIVPGAGREAVQAAALKALGADFQVGTPSAVLNATAVMQMGYALFDMLGLLTLFIGGFLIFNTFRTVVLERRHDLGMLRALGAERRQVTAMILVESLVQGAVGTALGLAAGYAMAAGTSAWVMEFIGQYITGVDFAITFQPLAFVLAITFGMLTTLIAGYLPARAAGRVSPLAALRPTPPSEVRRAGRISLIVGLGFCALAVLLLIAGATTAALGAILFLLGAAIAAAGLVAPMARLLSPLLTLWFAREGDVARGNLVRQPGRAAITGGTLMVGLAMLVVSAATVASLQTFVTDMVQRNFASDLLVMPQSIVLNTNLGAAPGLAERLRALPGVDMVGSVRAGTTLANGQAVTVLGIDPDTYPEISG